MKGWCSILGGALFALPFASAQLMGFKATVEEISLLDVNTQIPSIQTIFNNEPFDIYSDIKIATSDASFTGSSFTMKWKTYVDDVVVAEGEQYLSGLETLFNAATNTEELDEPVGAPSPSSRDSITETIFAGRSAVSNSGKHVVRVEVDLDGDVSSHDRKYQSYESGASFAPLIAILLLAMTTHLVEFSLGCGIFVGACMVYGTVIEGFKRTLDVYILGAINNEDHAYVYLFTLFMAGFVGILEKSGGILGFTKMMSRYARSPRTGQLCSLLTGVILFFDDYANILIAGPCMKPVQDAVMTSREKLAFVVDATAAPIASITPVSSWVGFEVSLIQTELDKISTITGEDPTVGTSGFGVFLQTIRYRYYPIYMLFLIPMLILSQRDFGPMLVAERLVRVYGRTDGGDGKVEDVPDAYNKNAPSAGTPQRWMNLVVPVILLIFYIFYLLVKTGSDGSGNQDFLDIMQGADSYSALLWGTMATALTTMAFYLIQFKKDGKPAYPRLGSFVPSFLYSPMKKCICKNGSGEEKEYPEQLMTWHEGMDAFLAGMEHVFGAIVVLTLAWAAGEIMTAVGLDRFFSQLIVQGNLDYRMLPTISFVVSIFIAFATGSSWGCMTIMFPLLLVPTYIASAGDPTIFYATTAGVLSGSVAGDHASPISDTTVLSSMSSGCQLLQHVKTQAPYVFVIVAWSTLVGTIPIGYNAYPNGVAMLLGFVLTLICTFLLGRQVICSTGTFGPLQELYLRFNKESSLHELKADTVKAFETGEAVERRDVFGSVKGEGSDAMEQPKELKNVGNDDTSGEKVPPPPPQKDDETIEQSPSSVRPGSDDAEAVAASDDGENSVEA